MIKVSGLTKSFGGRKVLKNLDFLIDQGEVVALIGVNGAGKTTLIRILSTLMRPDSGSLSLNNENMLVSNNSIRKHVGVVLHAPMVYGDLTGEENLKFFAKIYSLQHPQSRIEQVLNMIGLHPRRKDLVRTYSRGMQQRLAIGRAILHDPGVLLMDEPFTGLDQGSAERLGTLFTQFSNEGKSILFTTHDLSRIQSFATRVDILHNGKIAVSHISTRVKPGELDEIFQSITGKAVAAGSL